MIFVWNYEYKNQEKLWDAFQFVILKLKLKFSFFKKMNSIEIFLAP